MSFSKTIEANDDKRFQFFTIYFKIIIESFNLLIQKNIHSFSCNQLPEQGTVLQTRSVTSYRCLLIRANKKRCKDIEPGEI